MENHVIVQEESVYNTDIVIHRRRATLRHNDIRYTNNNMQLPSMWIVRRVM